MARIDVYLRSIERFGAAGAILTSGQAVTLRFPTGDRHATQVTHHDALVALVREIAPPMALDMIDRGQSSSFDMDSGNTSYTLTVNPQRGSWQVIIEPAEAPKASAAAPTPAAAAVPAPAAAPARQARAGTEVSAPPQEMPIERGQYAVPDNAGSTSGSFLFDQLTQAARQARASDVLIATGAPPAMRTMTGIQPIGDGRPMDAEAISREVGIVAPADVRAQWTETGQAIFTYGDGVGRVRATLTWDHRGPGATLRMLVGEPPAMDRIGIGREVSAWLEERGLILVAGPTGIGKTTTLAALVRQLGEAGKRVVTLEDPIEIIHVTSPWISQRALREHVPNLAEGVAYAMREGADAIVIGAVTSADGANAVIDCLNAGHLVLTTIATTKARHAVDQLVDLLPYDRRDLARAALDHGLLGSIAPIIKAGGRSFEVVVGRGG
ncbi:MAG: Flp pilus assembly complex ATPase component TadA [Deltaproteobacteria bacterium]|nr:Flp pilus assembly complex ATPase component TadA [Deltaproteobacteria bacterium]